MTRRLEEEVEKARHHERWKVEYMTLLERDELMREEGREEERENTECERKRADQEQQRAEDYLKEIEILKAKLAQMDL